MADLSILKKMLMFRDLREESLRKVKVYKTSSDGKEHIIHIFGDGYVFGEVTIYDKTPYPATSEVLEDNSRIGMIRNDRLEELIKEDATLALELVKVLCRRLLMASVEIQNLAFKDTLQRTAIALLKLSKTHGVTTSKGTELNLDITRQELANLVGTTRESVTRALTKLKKEKVIDIGENIVITDTDELLRWID